MGDSPASRAPIEGTAGHPKTPPDRDPIATGGDAAEQPRPLTAESSNAPSSHIEPDLFTDDEGYAESTTTSYVTSLASDIRKGIEEGGRTYAAYGIHKPWMPVDDREVCMDERFIIINY
jgi:hypothetical protein